MCVCVCTYVVCCLCVSMNVCVSTSTLWIHANSNREPLGCIWNLLTHSSIFPRLEYSKVNNAYLDTPTSLPLPAASSWDAHPTELNQKNSISQSFALKMGNQAELSKRMFLQWRNSWQQSSWSLSRGSREELTFLSPWLSPSYSWERSRLTSYSRQLLQLFGPRPCDIWSGAVATNGRPCSVVVTHHKHSLWHWIDDLYKYTIHANSPWLASTHPTLTFIHGRGARVSNYKMMKKSINWSEWP